MQATLATYVWPRSKDSLNQWEDVAAAEPSSSALEYSIALNVRHLAESALDTIENETTILPTLPARSALPLVDADYLRPMIAESQASMFRQGIASE